jgi:hypothetical protein
MKAIGKITATAATSAVAAVPAMLSADPSAALARIESALAQVEADIAGLLSQREAALMASDDLSAVVEIDARLDNRRRSAAIHHERLQALEGQIHAQQQRDRAAAREKAIEAVSAKLYGRIGVDDSS